MHILRLNRKMADIWKDRYPKLMKNLNYNNNINSKKSKLNQPKSFEEEILNDKNLLLTNSSLWPLQGFLNHNLLARIHFNHHSSSTINSIHDTNASPAQHYDTSPCNLTHLKSTNKSIILETLSDFTISGSTLSSIKGSAHDNDDNNGTQINKNPEDLHGGYNSDINSAGDEHSTSSSTAIDIHMFHDTMEDLTSHNHHHNTTSQTLADTCEANAHDCNIGSNNKHKTPSDELFTNDDPEHSMTAIDTNLNESTYILKEPSDVLGTTTTTTTNAACCLKTKVKIEKNSEVTKSFMNTTTTSTSISDEQVIPYIGVKVIRLAKSQYCAVVNSK